MKFFKLSSLKKRTQVVIVLVLVFLLWTLVPPVGAFFISLFLLFWVFRIDPKILGGITIGLLVTIPILQYFDMQDRAEQAAVYVYFLLAIIVILQIIHARKQPDGDWIQKESNKAAGQKQDTEDRLPPIRHNPLVDTRPLRSSRTTKDGDIEYIVEGKTYRISRNASAKDDEEYARVYPQIEPRDEELSIVETKHEKTVTTKEVKFVQPSYRRDMEREHARPVHRLAREEDYIDDKDTIPRHLTLPERLKALSDKQRAGLKSVKPDLDDIINRKLDRR